MERGEPDGVSFDLSCEARSYANARRSLRWAIWAIGITFAGLSLWAATIAARATGAKLELATAGAASWAAVALSTAVFGYLTGARPYDRLTLGREGIALEHVSRLRRSLWIDWADSALCIRVDDERSLASAGPAGGEGEPRIFGVVGRNLLAALLV